VDPTEANAMKLLMTTDTIGGVWTYALDVAAALAPHGVEVALATMGAPMSAAQRRDAGAVGNIVVHESTYKLEWMENPWEDVGRAGRWLLDLEHEVSADVVHLNGYAHGALPFCAPIFNVAHSCVLSWWRAVKGEAAPSSWNRYRDAVARGIAGADVVVAPTAAMLASLGEHYGTARATRVISNGRSGALYRAGRKQPIILAAGRLWDQAKNIAALQRVAPRLPWPVCVAGEERSPDGQGATLESSIRPLGMLAPAQLARWFSRASIYALPARYEPFGLSALEAGLSGCALVLGDIASLREVWGDAALFVPPDDLGGLESVLMDLIESEPLRRQMGARAQERASLYSLSRLGDGYLRLYEDMRRRQSREADERVVEPGASLLSVDRRM
jgi:glycosyltransferase involved in cell wall biosynthesis